MLSFRSHVNMWKQQGNVYLWKYQENIKNYPGWNMTADLLGGQSLSELLSKMDNSEFPCERTIVISPLTSRILAIPNNQNGRAAWTSPNAWKIIYRPEIASGQYWLLKEIDVKLSLTIGREKLHELQQGIEDILRGKGDYSIGAEMPNAKREERLWLW